MTTAPFGQRLAEAVHRIGAPVAVGIDPHLDRLPAQLQERYAGRSGRDFRQEAARAVRDFGRMAISALAGRVAAVKPQVAFYEQLGAPGFAALEELCARARQAGLLIIADAKRGDISSTAAAYARTFLDPQGPVAADALTVSPYLGLDTLDPFLERCRAHGAGLFVLLRTTNPGSAGIQHHGEGQTLAEVIARGLDRRGRDLVGAAGMSSLGAVVGASAAEDARRLRELMPRGWFLVPGVGAQGGSVHQALAGMREDGLGALPVASRSVLFPAAPGDLPIEDDPAQGIARRADALVRAIQDAVNSR